MCFLNILKSLANVDGEWNCEFPNFINTLYTTKLSAHTRQQLLFFPEGISGKSATLTTTKDSHGLKSGCAGVMYQCYLILAEKIQPLSCLTISSRLSYQSGILEGRQWSWFPKLNSLYHFVLFCFSLYSPSCSGAYYVDEAGLDLGSTCFCLTNARNKDMCHHHHLA